MNDIIAGRQPVLEALKSGTALEKIVLLYGVHGPAIQQIHLFAKQRGVPLTEVNKQRFQELAQNANAQGVIALTGSTQYVEIEQLMEASKLKNEPPFFLVLDEIEDPHNLGALIRTAECAGAHGVIIPKHHSATITQTVTKASAGASMHLPIAKVTNIAQTIDELKNAGLWIVGTDMSGDRMYYDVDYKGAIAVVVGNEGKGIRRLVREKCDFLVKIPMYGKISSLNASVAGALILYEAARGRTRK